MIINFVRRTRANFITALVVLLVTTTSAFAAATITGSDVRDFSLTGKDIRASSITGVQIRNSSLTGLDVRNGSIGALDIAAVSITDAHLAPNSVGAARLADGAVTTAKLASGAVTGATISDGSVTAADLAGDAVTGAQIADGSIAIADISVAAQNAFTALETPTSMLGRLNAVDGPGSGLDADTIDGVQGAVLVTSGTIAGGSLAGSYPNPTIAAGAVGTAQLQAESIRGSEITNGTLRAADIAVAAGFTTINLPPINVGQCTSPSIVNASVLALDMTHIFPPTGLPDGLVVFGLQSDVASAARFRVCNTTASAIDAGNFVWRYYVVRI